MTGRSGPRMDSRKMAAGYIPAAGGACKKQGPYRAAAGTERQEGRNRMEKMPSAYRKRSAVLRYRWREEALVILALTTFAFFVNRGVELKGLYMDDLYLWSCYGEQSFWEFVCPIGSSRFRFVYYLLSYIELGLVGSHVDWFVAVNILVNSMIAYTVFRFARRLSNHGLVGFVAGILYLWSRMSYYQIAQVSGLMESMALWTAIGILYCFYRYVNDQKEEPFFFYTACALYFINCFIHERYMALLPLFFVVLLMRKNRRPLDWALPLLLFVLVQLIRLATIGTVLPAGTGHTNVAETFQLKQAVIFAFQQVLYMFGINLGPEYLCGVSWANTPRLVKLAVAAAILVLAVLIVLYAVRIVKDREERPVYLRNSLLFVLFIGLCIGCSSVTIRLEVRWIYVSMTAAWLFLSYMCGVISGTVAFEDAAGKRPAASYRMDYQGRVLCLTGLLIYGALTGFAETSYRGYYPNIYFWHQQQAYNSLAEETWEKYGEDVFGKKIYILKNTYNVSDFYADTFFKTFDKERKAEGTEVIFVDSIRDFGLVTNNMLVLREDPAFYAYQDITDLVRNLKCESVYGYYADGWMDESAQVRIMAGSTGVVHLQLLYPGVMEGTEEMTITIDGETVRTVQIDQNILDLDLTAKPYQTMELTFENNFYLKDAMEQRGEKRLSIIVNFTAD